jgi:hypothetical protein
MISIKVSKEQLQNPRQLFTITDSLQKYLKGDPICSEDPDTGEQVQIFVDDSDTLRLDIYRRNGWIMECTCERRGFVSEYAPKEKWRG